MRIFLLLTSLILNLVSGAQVAVPTGHYFQDFGTIDMLSWTNNSTYPGWYMVGTFQAHLNITTASPSNTGGFYTYECNNNNDQKIGSRASGGSGTLRYGVVLQNTTGSAVSHVRVSYKGYQLSLAQNGNTNVITFDYIVGATAPAISAGGGTAVPALNFTELQSNGSSGSNQVMGYPCTQMANMANCITVSIPNNSYILLRWTDVDDSGNDHHMAIDDIDVQFLSTNLTVNSATICSGGSASLTATGASNFTWTPATTLSSPTGSMVTANPGATTTYTVSGSVLSCPVKTITAMVTVNPATPLTVNSSTICSSASASLTATGSSSYSWAPSAGLSATTGSMVVANPGTTTVYTVTGAGGSCSAAPANSTVTVLQAPVIAAASQTICSSTSATLSATGSSTYTWSPATALSAVNGSSVVANPSVTTVYTINGSNGSCAATPVTLTLSVITSPTLTVNSSTICPLGTATLTAGGASTYTWMPATGLSSTNGNNVTANPSSTTVYTVSGTTAGCGGAVAISTVTVLSVPVISVNSESICATGTASLTAAGAVTYSWSPATGLSSPTGTTVTANPAATTVYTVSGSSGTCPLNPVTATVTVVANPVLSVNSQTICSSTSATLQVNGATNYTWSPAIGLSSTTGNNVTANPASTTVYTVNGSTGSCNASPVTLTLTVVSSPTTAVNSGSICASSSINLMATGATTYSWLPSAGLSATTGAMVIANPAATTVYTVTGTIGNCTSSATSTVLVVPFQSAAFSYASSDYCLNSPDPVPMITGVSGGLFSCNTVDLLLDQVTGIISMASTPPATYTVSYSTQGICPDKQDFVLQVNAVPSLSVNPATICSGDNALLTALPSVAGGSFNWMPGNKNTSSITVSPTTSMTYTVSYNANGCSVSEKAVVNVNAKPSVIISSSSNYVADGDEVLLTASGGDSFLWDNGIMGNTIKFTPYKKAEYCVTATNTSGCQNSNCITIDVIKESTLYVPNSFTPNGDRLNDVFLIPATNMAEFNIKIFDRWGALLFESNSLDISWDGTYKGTEVAPNVYVYTITGLGLDKVSYEKRGHITVIR